MWNKSSREGHEVHQMFLGIDLYISTEHQQIVMTRLQKIERLLVQHPNAIQEFCLTGSSLPAPHHCHLRLYLLLLLVVVVVVVLYLMHTCSCQRMSWWCGQKDLRNANNHKIALHSGQYGAQKALWYLLVYWTKKFSVHQESLGQTGSFFFIL